MSYLLSDHVCATFCAHPYLVPSVRVDVQPSARAKGLFCWLPIIRVCYCKLPFEDEVRGQARMSVRWVVSVTGIRKQSASVELAMRCGGFVRAVAPGEDV